MIIAALVGVVGLVAALLTGAVLAYAIRRNLLDHPNHRSAHQIPTPRGGGLAIALAVGAGLAAAMSLRWVDLRLGGTLLGGGALIAVVGWIDDRRGLSPLVRAGAHIIAAALAVYILGGLPQLIVGTSAVTLGRLGDVIALLGIVWLTNLYNFMDGIDGLAGVEAVQVAGFAVVMASLAGSAELGVAAALVGAGSLGFLLWNWPPARIFMGDVGSGLLGYCFGVLALAGEGRGVPLLGWFILLGVFVVDATVTLIRRMARGEAWYAAHRSHAYQRAALSGWGHKAVTMIVAGVNLGLGAAVVGGVSHRRWLVPLLVGSYVLLLAGYWVVDRRHPMAAKQR
jgi:Fuc2NAc and GlcNAc transferase